MLTELLNIIHLFTIWYYGEGFVPTWIFATIIGVIIAKYRHNSFAGFVTINIIIAVASLIGFIDKYLHNHIR